MAKNLIRYNPKPTLMERIRYKLALWMWMLGLKRFGDE